MRQRLIQLFTSWKALLGISLSLLGTALAFWKLNFNELYHVFLNARIINILAAMGLLVLSVLIRSIRWHLLIPGGEKLRFNSTFKATMVGYFGNNVFPLRMGELLRAYFLNRLEPVPTSELFATIIVERVIDVFGGIFLILYLFFSLSLPIVVRLTLVVLIITIGIFLVLSYLFNRTYGRIGDWLEVKFRDKNYKIAVHAKKWLESFNRGLTGLWNTKHPFRVIFWTVVLWLLYIFNVWLIIAAFGINPGLTGSIFVLVITTAAISIPSGPGYIGTYHAAGIYALTYLGIALSHSQAIAIALHAAGFIPMTFLGAIFLLKEHLKITEIIRE